VSIRPSLEVNQRQEPSL